MAEASRQRGPEEGCVPVVANAAAAVVVVLVVVVIVVVVDMATVRAHWVCLGEGDVESGVEAGEARGPCRGVRRESASEAELCCWARDVMCVDSRQ